MKRQRVVVVTDTMHPWFVGGKEERLRNLHGSVNVEKFEVIFATMKWWDGPTPSQHVALCRKLDIYKYGKRSIRSSLYFALACFKVMKLRPDLVEADQIPFLQIWPLKIVCLILRIPLCVTWHEVWGNKYWDEYLGRFGFLAAAIERLTMKLPDKIIAVSQMTSNRLVTAGVDPKKITLINNFVNAEDIIGSTTNLPNTDLLFVGRLISHKRVDLILEALSLLVLEGIYPTISIVGTGPELENLRTQAREKSIGQQINFYSEKLDSNDVWGLMASCKIFVSASEREGYGIAVLEAITAGAKVLVSNHEDNAARFLVSQDLGGIVEEQSPGAWADSIKNGLSEWTKNTEFVFRPDLNLKNFGIEYMDSWKRVLAIK